MEGVPERVSEPWRGQGGQGTDNLCAKALGEDRSLGRQEGGGSK